MKKFTLALLAVIAVATAFTSCKKVLDAFFDPIESPLSVDITIPVITDTTAESTLGASGIYFNLDSIIRKYTKDVFSINNIKSVKLKDMTITLLDADADNNLGNFESARIAISSNTNATPVTIGTTAIADAFATNITIPISSGVELKNYLNGAEMNLTLYGKARRATTKELHARVNVTLRSE